MWCEPSEISTLILFVGLEWWGDGERKALRANNTSLGLDAGVAFMEV